MKILGSGLSPYVQRVLLAARHKGLEIPVEQPDGGPGGEAHLRRNPMGKIPVLLVGDLVLPESNVILAYLEDSHPTKTLLPGNPAERAHARLLACVQDTYGPKSFGAFMSGDASGIDAVIAQTRLHLGYLERLWRPTGAAHAAGHGFSVADCALIPFFCIYETVPPQYGLMGLVREHPQVADWWQQAKVSEPAQFATTTLRDAISALLAPPQS